jgi:L-arabinose isomerase
MLWLNVPHLKQAKAGWCLPACAAMVTAYWQQPLVQADIAHWLDAHGIGVASSRIQRLGQRGFQVVYSAGSLAELQTWLAHKSPVFYLSALENCRTGA